MKVVKNNNYNPERNSNSQWSNLEYDGKLFVLEEIKNDLQAIVKLNDAKFKDLPDEEFVELVSRFYDITLTKQEFLNILSKANGIHYDKIWQINTTIISKKMQREGNVNALVTYQDAYIAAVSDDLNIDQEHNYSKAEINQMAKSRQIVCLCHFKIPKGVNPPLTFKPEPTIDNVKMAYIYLRAFPMTSSPNELLDESELPLKMILINNDSVVSQKVSKEAIKILRKRLNRKKVLKYCEQLLFFLNDNFLAIRKMIFSKFFGYDEEEDNIAKDKWLALLKEIKQMTKSLLLNLKY